MVIRVVIRNRIAADAAASRLGWHPVHPTDPAQPAPGSHRTWLPALERDLDKDHVCLALKQSQPLFVDVSIAPSGYLAGEMAIHYQQATQKTVRLPATTTNHRPVEPLSILKRSIADRAVSTPGVNSVRIAKHVCTRRACPCGSLGVIRRWMLTGHREARRLGHHVLHRQTTLQRHSMGFLLTRVLNSNALNTARFDARISRYAPDG